MNSHMQTQLFRTRTLSFCHQELQKWLSTPLAPAEKAENPSDFEHEDLERALREGWKMQSIDD